MSDICLFALNSSYAHTNLAVRCIKNSLALAGFDAQILEFSLKDRRRAVLDALYRADAKLYGFSAYIWNITELFAFAAELKALHPQAHIVFGGPEVSFNSKELLAAHPYIDCIVTGEGEDAWAELASSFFADGTLPSVIEGGIFDGFLDQPAVYEAGDMGKRMVYYESSRGCPFRCAYCLSGAAEKVRAKSVDQTLADLLAFEKNEGIRVVKFVDRTFNFDRARANAIWRGLLSEAYGKSYHFEICAELLDEEALSLLAAFPKGKVQLEIGVQSTNPETLLAVNRSPDTDRLLENISRLHALGNMHIHADLIAGLPKEGFARFGQSFDALFGRCDMLQLGFLKLLHGSVLRRDAARFDCVYSPMPPYEVLATDCLSFDELTRLHTIDALCDRFVNSGAFSRAVSLLGTRHSSPFSMLDGMAQKLTSAEISLHELPQAKAYTWLYDVLHEGEDAPLAEALLLDFLTHQNRTPPIIGGFGCPRVEDDMKRHFLQFAAKTGIECFAPAVEVRQFADRRFVLERQMGRAFVPTEDGFSEI